MVTFTVHHRRIRTGSTLDSADYEQEKVLVEGLQSPVLPRVGELLFYEGHSYPVEEIEHEFDETKKLKYILVRVYG